ncbi:conjugal transfer protein TraX [Escherichia coli]|nr:conjugal transfer protein TraX [Escherichia coli]
MALAATALPVITLIRILVCLLLMSTIAALCASKALIASYRLWQLNERRVSEDEQGTFPDYLQGPARLETGPHGWPLPTGSTDCPVCNFFSSFRGADARASPSVPEFTVKIIPRALECRSGAGCRTCTGFRHLSGHCECRHPIRMTCRARHWSPFFGDVVHKIP